MPADLGEDLLSGPARAHHRNVLLVASIGIVVSWLDLVPREISAIGVALESDDRRAVLIVLLVALAYFSAAFLIYGAVDFIAWIRTQIDGRNLASGTASDRVRYREAFEEQLRQHEGGNEEQRSITAAQLDERFREMNQASLRHRLITILLPLAIARALIDFVVPITVAVAAAVMLLAELGALDWIT